MRIVLIISALFFKINLIFGQNAQLLLNSFDNSYALENLIVYNPDSVSNSKGVSGGTLGSTLEHFNHYIKFSDDDEVINEIEKLFLNDTDVLLSYLTGNEKDLAVVLFLHHYFKIKHRKTNLTLLLALRDADLNDLNQIQASFGSDFKKNIWFSVKDNAVSFWINYLKDNNYLPK